MFEEVVSYAVRVLGAPGLRIEDAATAVPSTPGLYSFHGGDSVWKQLGLGSPPDDRPLYVGKSESSLAARDVRTHFAAGRTGSSTLRRTLAALLVDRLDLVACPRNPAKPGHFSNFGLEPEGDERLSRWMAEHLWLAVWPSPAGIVLNDVETAVLQRLIPPLNLSKVATPWKPMISSARRRMAAGAASWSPAR
jgi:hypothetical protein